MTAGTGTAATTPTGGIVAVHAHPDDESITMGGTLARYASAGVPVTLVTATLGEQGELMHGRFGRLAAEYADQLGGFRFAELAAACRALGIGDHRMLGGLGRFRDSGMAGSVSAAHPRAFIHAQDGGPAHEDAVAALTRILDERRPGAVLTYDATGGYGHPDHIAARQVAVAAFARYAESLDDGVPSGLGAPAGALAHSQTPNPGETGTARAAAPPSRLLEVVRPRTELDRALETLWRGPIPDGLLRPTIDELGTLVGSGDWDVELNVGPWAGARRAAMAAHSTQLDVWAGPVDGFALTNLKAQPLLPIEYFRMLAGPEVPPGSDDILVGM